MSTVWPVADSFGVTMCHIFDEDPNKVRSLTIRIAMDDIVTVEVERNLHKDEADGVKRALKRFMVTRKT